MKIKFASTVLFLAAVLSASLPSYALTIPSGNAGSNTVDIRPATTSPVPSGMGSFRTRCKYSHAAYNDPIVYPNQPGASHLHIFFGNTGTNASSTYSSLLNSGNGTCVGGVANRSAYWVPAMIKNGNEFVMPGQFQVYYKAFDPVQPLPAGLKMIAGDGHAEEPQDTKIMSWGCRSSTGQLYISDETSIPACNQGESVEASLNFPSCWNGVNLDSADHKSHMSYTGLGGVCPSSHPVSLAHITYKANWPVTSATGTAGWRISSDHAGDPAGQSFHADWFGAWIPSVQETFRINCNNASKDCGSGLLGDGTTLFFKP